MEHTLCRQLWVVAVFVFVFLFTFVFVSSILFVFVFGGIWSTPAAVDGCGICAAAHPSVSRLPPTKGEGGAKLFLKLLSFYLKYLDTDHMRGKSLSTTSSVNGLT